MSKTWKLLTGTALGLALAAGTGADVVTAREQGPGGPGGFVGAQGPGAPGRPGRRGRGGPGGPLGLAGLRGVGLTEAQREQVKAVMESHKAEFEAQATKMLAARTALNDAVSAETFDEGAIRQKAADVAIVEADGAVLRARVHSEVWALLTPEQQAKAKAMRTQMEQRRGEMRQRFEQRRKQRQERRQLQRG